MRQHITIVVKNTHWWYINTNVSKQLCKKTPKYLKQYEASHITAYIVPLKFPLTNTEFKLFQSLKILFWSVNWIKPFMLFLYFRPVWKINDHNGLFGTFKVLQLCIWINDYGATSQFFLPGQWHVKGSTHKEHKYQYKELKLGNFVFSKLANLSIENEPP